MIGFMNKCTFYHMVVKIFATNMDATLFLTPTLVLAAQVQ
jgi:hypothetical protein